MAPKTPGIVQSLFRQAFIHYKTLTVWKNEKSAHNGVCFASETHHASSLDMLGLPTAFFVRMSQKTSLVFCLNPIFWEKQ